MFTMTRDLIFGNDVIAVWKQVSDSKQKIWGQPNIDTSPYKIIEFSLTSTMF